MNKKENKKKIILSIISFIVIAILVILFLILFKPKDATVSQPSAVTTLVYNGKSQKLLNSGTTDGGTWLYKLDGGEYSTNVPEAVNAGKYKVYYKLKGNKDFNSIDETFVNVTIAKAHASIVVNSNPIVSTYGQTISIPRATSNFGSVTCDKKSSDLVNAGTYTLTYYVEATDNYFGDLKTVSVKINKLGVNEPTVNGLYTYTGLEQTVSLSGVETYMSSTDSLKATNVGSYTVKYTLDKNHQWNDGSDGIVNWNIVKGNALITVDQSPIINTFGETVTIPQATSNFGTVTCDKVSSDFINAGTYTITYQVEGTDNYNGDTKTIDVTINKLGVDEPTVIGTYTYTGSPLTVSLNGVMAYMSTNSSLVGTDADTYNIIYKLDNNHCWATGSDGVVNWNIAKATPIITVDETPIVKTYGQTISIPQATSNFGDVTCDTVSSNLINVGTYTITYKVNESNNFNAATKTVSVTIEKLGVNEPTVTGSYTYTGASQKVSLSGVKGYMITSDSLYGTNVNTYTINYQLDSNHKWNEGSDGVITWSIGKGQASITVNQTAIVKTYGDSFTIPTAKTNLGTVTCDKVKADLVNVGTYTITYTVLGNDNYNGDSKTVSVTINQLGVDEPTVSGSYTYTGNSQTVSLSGVESYMSTTDSLSQTNVGEYTINYSLDGNHKWNTGSDGKVSWNIAKANAKITLEINTSEYEYNPEYSYNLPSATSTFGTVTCDTVSSQITELGEYTLTYTVEGTANYNGDITTTKITVKKGNPIVNISGIEAEYESNKDIFLIAYQVREGVKIYFAVVDDDTENPADSDYSEDIPKASKAETYYVWYKVPETTYYYKVEPTCISVKISGADCIAKGTNITMGDGSLKKIEDIQEGEEVLTFNHEKGIYEAKSAYYIFKGSITKCAFTLNFEDGNKISIIGDHAFFELESLQYVVIYESNATEFIGKHYYNATTKKYTKLVSVTFETTPVEYYELYTTNFNCIAENMLNAPADNVAFVNYYKFNADLTIDKEQLEKDIATYGLYAYSEDAPYTKEEFDEYNWKYAYIVVGKGLMTYDELIAFRDDYYSNLE